MTMPSSGSISLSQANAEFGKYNLGGFRGTRWYLDTNARGLFTSTGAISLADLYSKRVNSPVVPSSSPRVYNTSGNIAALPMFNNLTVTAVSGQGGQGGTNGNCANATSGGTGGDSSLTGYVATSGGGPGGAPNGNAGSTISATTTLSITDGNQATILALYGTTPNGTVGAGGGGGAAGAYTNYYFQCDLYGWVYGFWQCISGHNYGVCNGNAGAGSAGANGYISISWT